MMVTWGMQCLSRRTMNKTMVDVYVFGFKEERTYCTAAMLKGMGYRLKNRGMSKGKEGYKMYYIVVETEKNDVGEILHDIYKVVLCRGGYYVVALNENEYVDVEAKDLLEYFGHRWIFDVENECDKYYDVDDLTYCIPILYNDVYYDEIDEQVDRALEADRLKWDGEYIWGDEWDDDYE